jgi:transposase
LVVDSSSIAVQRRARRTKTERLEVGRLLARLMRHVGGEPGGWQLVRVPAVEEEDGRVVHRGRRTLAKESTRSIHRIKGWLMTQGLRRERVPTDCRAWLARVQLWAGSCVPAGLRHRLEREDERWHLGQQQIPTLQPQRRTQLAAREDPTIAQVQRLRQWRGIGPESAWLSGQEVFGWRQFRNRREVGA